MEEERQENMGFHKINLKGSMKRERLLGSGSNQSSGNQSHSHSQSTFSTVHRIVFKDQKATTRRLNFILG